MVVVFFALIGLKEQSSREKRSFWIQFMKNGLKMAHSDIIIIGVQEIKTELLEDWIKMENM
jgi:hypothetical protein